MRVSSNAHDVRKRRFMSHRKKALNWEQVRDRIDSGATGEKVAVSDPAAAPLGTDDEAAGVPSQPTEDEIKQKSAAR
jgi:hypothetical protein